MCGLTGCMGEIGVNEEKIFRHLLILDSVRGEHSTGAVFVPTNGDPFIAKQVGNPFELFNDKRWDDGMRRKNKVLIGHNRFATQGEVNRRNAHPYNYGDVYGAHNGTLTQRWKLDKNSEFAVDSQSLYHHIAYKGVEDAISKIQGAWALTWWDDAESEMCLLRNSERPLWLMESENGKTIFWASERWMLDIALDRAGCKHQEGVQLAENLLLRIPVDNKGTIGEAVSKKLEAPKYIPPTSRQTATGTHTAGGAVTNTANRFPHTTATQGSVSPTTGTVLTLPAKKEQLTPLPDYVQSYLDTKDQVLEVISRVKLSHVSEYLLCEDPMDKRAKFRLFLPKNTPVFIGEMISADVMSFINADGGYFTLNAKSVKSIILPKDEATYTDHRGKELTKEAWEKTYRECAWCTTPLDAGENNSFTRGGDCLCPSCSNDPSLSGYTH